MRGAAAVWGRGLDADGAPPYWPWRQLLRATAEVYLSERTAQNHVQHILTKLALSNRSQLAVWMTRQK